ncbi:MAG: helix-hairpin-helix domain-containing protein [Candidatus Eisenbacteria bacterium]|uniref:Helix-hairpin-helix domain-containing protein n=1 Tax=Eiseniibacteriota bacterium TaxID=2212470 RepID=A0A538SH96_UNCEI|nr:MAG: helix-hairpin-helix domain-containing protein [Candidatus Eisenbacteria bacterium]TMQ61534.1 MAG: helix-hairpin-helix domain-containing protein [Candidatus Eisenbacteria bacterium]
MIRSFPVRTLSALAFAMILPVAALAATGTDAKATTAHPAHMAHAKRMPAVDINTASKEDLMKLPGITDETAQKIIDGRPYKSKAELTKKSILTKAEYGKVRSRIVARQEKSAEMKAPEKAPETKAAEATPATPESK